MLKTGLVEPLMQLLRCGAISSAKYEKLYTFLDHARMGLVRDVYKSDTYLRRAREVRALGLEVPANARELGDDIESELDVRALVHAIACEL